ncbi:nicotinamide N-methyltransferase [Microcaecilia unicolor]|uniref:Nicotinamide N-methyltransferase-like n=1 Tax=Microcaecilia unicolor TaxID=1415580 RepID=A0A6P7ZG27_9AMPH|nr:nicotinamide N-methyltransferase-like [Microcaecilia unicolor]
MGEEEQVLGPWIYNAHKAASASSPAACSCHEPRNSFQQAAFIQAETCDTMCDFADAEVYQQQFDPRAYLETFYNFSATDLMNDIVKFPLTHLVKAFSAGDVKGDICLELGSGPCIHYLLSACDFFKEVIASDCVDSCLREIEKWLKKEQGAYDWNPAVRLICELEGGRETCDEKEEKLRRKLKRLLKCDVTKRNPLEPLVLPQVDCVLVPFCLQVACKDQTAYISALKNINTLLKPGGHLVVVETLNESSYTVGQTTLFVQNMSEEFLRKAISEAGFALEKLERLQRADNSLQNHTDYEGTIFIVARKLR